MRETHDPVHVPVQRARLACARAAVRPGRGRPAGLDPARRARRRRRARARRRPGARDGRSHAAAVDERRPPLRARARRRGRRDHARALPRARPAGRDEARPDARQRGRPGRRGGDPRARRRATQRRERLRRGVRRRRRRRPLDRRPDRRHPQLRPRHPRLGDAARARARRASSIGRRLGAGARPPLVGDPRRGRRGSGAGAAERSTCRRSAGSRTQWSRRPPPRRCRRAGPGCPSGPGPAVLSATSGSTASSPRAPSTSRPTSSSSSGTTRRSSSSSKRQAAAARRSTATATAPGKSFLATNGAIHAAAVALLC